MKFILAAIALGFFTTGALASDLPSEPVPYSDLDLSTQDGRAVLEARIDQAINRICPEVDARNLTARYYVQRCRHIAWDGAHQRLAEIYTKHIASK